jgi:hypothetical protein
MMNREQDTGISLMQGDDDAGFKETDRFEVRSVTGACYTLLEQTRFDVRAVCPGPGPSPKRYRTAYAGLPVTANDDGSFTIVDTHTRLLRNRLP